MRRRWKLAAPLVVLALVAAGCGDSKHDDERVVAAVDATAPLARRIVYRTEVAGLKIVVQGLVEDDFRYKLQLSLNGVPSIEEVVVDDAVAIRFLDPKLVDRYIDPAVSGKVDLATDIEGASVLDALRARRWVIDPAGAPSSLLDVNATLGEDRGDTDPGSAASYDPLDDARNVLSYVRLAYLGKSTQRFDPEAITKTYRSDEDPFPKPDVGAKITRYDTVMFPITKVAASTGTLNQTSLPFPANFRRMAAFVKDGKLVSVREEFGVTPRTAVDLSKFIVALIKTTGGDELAAGFQAQVDKLADDFDALSKFLNGALNTFYTNSGQAPITFHSMSLDISDLGDTHITVSLPTDHVVAGNLAVLTNLGRKPVTTGDSSEGSAGREYVGGDDAIDGANRRIERDHRGRR